MKGTVYTSVYELVERERVREIHQVFVEREGEREEILQKLRERGGKWEAMPVHISRLIVVKCHQI